MKVIAQITQDLIMCEVSSWEIARLHGATGRYDKGWQEHWIRVGTEHDMVAAFKAVPAHQLTRKTYKGKTVWVYPDRDICGCMYVGSQNAYNRYIKKATQNMISTAVRANDSDDPYSPTSFDYTLDYDWASDPEASGLYSDW